MAVTFSFYNSYKQDILLGNIDWETDAINVSLHTSAYVLSIDNHSYFNDLSNEISSANYTAGGTQLSGIGTIQDNTGDRGMVSASDLLWEDISATVRYAILYKDTGVASTSPLIGCINFGENKTMSSDNLALEWDATDGIFNIT
jgi:hypothetical protein